jgi:YVTN family beta-propeller protein
VETRITVGNDPCGVAYNSDDNLIYVANNGDGTVSVIDGLTYEVATINGVAGAHGVAYDSGHSLVYVTKRDSNELAVIDASTNTVSRTLPVGSQPHGVAYNPTSHKIYVANYGDNTVTIIDANTMTTTTTILGLSEPAHIAVNEASNKVYVSNHGNGTVTVIRGSDDSEPPESPISLGSSGPYGITADIWRNLIYVVSIDVANLDAPNLVTIDGETDRVKSDQWGRVNIHKSDDSLVPLRVIAINPFLGPSAGGGHLYITSSSRDRAGDGSYGTDQLLMSRKGWPEGFNKPNPLDVGRWPEEGVAVDLEGNRVFVTAREVNRLTVIKDSGDHDQLCSEAFALDGYVIEPVP